MHRRRLVARATGAALVGVVAVALAASPAGAHAGGHLHGLADGALHPLTGIDHLLANPLLYVVGFVAITAALHAAGAFGGVVVRRVPTARVLAGAATVGVLLLG